MGGQYDRAFRDWQPDDRDGTDDYVSLEELSRPRIRAWHRQPGDYKGGGGTAVSLTQPGIPEVIDATERRSVLAGG